jgi:hypothetical protein
MMTSKYVFLFIYFCLGLVFVLGSTSCQSQKRNSILILAFDRLPSDAVTCNDDRMIENSGFATLCKESIRFTHSYTTSLQPAAAMASLLTGQYPYKHELHRSFDRISDQSQLISQVAQAEKYRTSFFSGSPHILKKTGLSKYFDVFDDSSPLTQRNYFKDFKLQTNDFFEWYNEDPQPFLSVIYNSELEFTNPSDGNSLEKLDEKLSTFFEKMKSEKLWGTTTVIVVGLNGVNTFQRLNETAFQNLHSENTQVVTMIKLPRLKGDEGIYWKNDTPIQLADLGRTLPYFLKNNPSNKITVDNEKFPVTHLWTLLTEKNSAIPALRPLLIEAPNTWTKKLSEAQFAILQNHELYIDTQKPGIFSTLSDRMESTNIYEEKLQNFEKIKLDLDEIRRKTQIQPISITPRNMNINATDRLISLNMSFENIWGLSFRNEAH